MQRCQHQGGEGLALNGMANVSEPLKSVVTDSKLKMLTSLNQNGMWPGKDILHSFLRRQNGHRHIKGA